MELCVAFLRVRNEVSFSRNVVYMYSNYIQVPVPARKKMLLGVSSRL